MTKFGVIYLFLLRFGIVLCFKCDTYVKYHEELGLSLYSGKIHEPFDMLDVAIGVPVPLEFIFGSNLVNYVEGYNSSHALLTLGIAMILNHYPDPNKVNIRKFMSENPGRFIFPSNNEQSVDILFEYQSSISVGDQLFVDYGEGWFQDRGIPMEGRESFLTDTNPEKYFRGCPFRYATLRENTLISSKNTSHGVVIEVLRAISLGNSPSLLNYHGPLTDVSWWTETQETNSDGTTGTVLTPWLLTGFGPFYGTSAEGREGNVEMRWETRDPVTGAALPPRSVLSIVTTRRIEKGEELIVSNSYQVTGTPVRRGLSL